MAQGYILHDVCRHVYANGGVVAANLSSLVSAITGLPLDVPTGSLLVCHSGDQSGNGAITFNPAWKRLDEDANVHDNLLIGWISDGSDTGPAPLWGFTPARGASVSVWTGDVWPDINTIISGRSDRGSNSTTLIAYNGCSVADDFALVIAAGRRFKSATSNGATVGDLTDGNFTQLPAINNVPNGNTVAMAWSYWQQTTKTNTALMSQALSIADTNANTQGSVIALKSKIAAGGLTLLDDRSMRGEL